MNEVGKVKRDIMQCFYDSNADVGHALNSRIYQHNNVFNYNPKEKSAMQAAFNKLAEKGLIEEKENNRICITDKGVNFIYSGTQKEYVEQVKNDIIVCFRESNSDIGHAFNERGFGMNYVQKYNPKKASVVEHAFDELVADGVIEAKNGKHFLTAYGVEKIY